MVAQSLAEAEPVTVLKFDFKEPFSCVYLLKDRYNLSLKKIARIFLSVFAAYMYNTYM